MSQALEQDNQAPVEQVALNQANGILNTFNQQARILP